MIKEADNSASMPPEFGAMEFFILAAIDPGGANSLYTLNQRAGLQSGSIRPTLSRLERRGLLSRAAAGPRRRREFQLTAAGKQFIQTTWRTVLLDHADIESILRSVCVADLMGEPSAANDYLKSMADERQRELESRPPEWPAYSQDINPLSTYKFMRSTSEGQRLNAEAFALRTIIMMRTGEEFDREGGWVLPEQC